MSAVVIDLEQAKADRIVANERPPAFSVAVTEDNLVVPYCEQTLTPTQALEFAELIRTRALECFGGRGG